jgi:hypothetical protein
LAVDPFGLSWPLLFRCENLDSRVLDSLGFPWILSSESRLFSGLHEIFVRKSLLSLFPGSRIAETGARGRGMRKRRIAHQASLNRVLLFRKTMSALIAITIDGLPPPSWPALCRPSTPSGSAIDSPVRITPYPQLLKLGMTVFSWMAGSSPAMTTKVRGAVAKRPGQELSL